MAHTYTYTGKTTEPNLSGIQFTDVPASTMTNKDIDECEWHESTEELLIHCPIAKSAADKTKLDTIVSDNS